MISGNHRPFILSLSALLFAAAAPVAFAQSNEIQVGYFKLKGPAADRFLEANYTRISLAYAHTYVHDPGSVEVQWAAGGTVFASGEAHYDFGSGGSGTLKSANYIFGGLRVLSPGALQFGIGLDLRAEFVGNSGAWGDTASSNNEIKFRPWVLGQASYTLRTGNTGVRIGLQAGFASADGARPSRELGALIGIRF